MESLNTALVFIALLLIVAVPYWWRVARKRREAVRIHEKSAKADLLEPATLHPRIDLLTCIGCGSCVRACPEEVLGLVDGRAAIINGLRCVGHALCEEVCPVEAITMGFGTPKQGMEIPCYDEHYRTNIHGVYIIGELGGIGLIRNAFDQGVKAVEDIVSMSARRENGAYDVAIVGAGPAGVAAALAARAHGLRHVVLEQDDLGGSVLHYPREKIVLTSPVDLPLYGRLKVSEISKEELLNLFTTVMNRYSLDVRTHQKVETILSAEHCFDIQTASDRFTAKKVVLALGRRGSPRKLEVPGEHLPHVYYRLIEAEKYAGTRALIVGGGDSAVEAAIALARQQGNEVTLSYRRESFVRLKEKNEKRIQEMMTRGKVRVIFNSSITEIQPDKVLIREKENIVHTLKNDYVFIFAGGELPSEFLKRIGVSLRTAEVQPHVA